MSSLVTGDIISSLNDEERDEVVKILNEISKTGTSRSLKELYDEDYNEIPVSIDTFIESDRYAGWFTNNGKDIYPYWRKELRNIFESENSYSEVALTGSIGVGKSTIAIIGLSYLLYNLMCLKDPHEYYNIGKGGFIYIVFFNATLTLSQGVAYTKFQNLLQNSPWFMEHGTLSGKKVIEYIPNGPIRFTVGSQVEHSLGKDIFCVSGETEILTEHGIKRIEDLDGKIIRVYSQNSEHNIVLSEPVLIQKTKEVKELYEIELEDGTIIKCTNNHQLRLSNGLYKRADELTEDDDIMECNFRSPGIYKITNLINNKSYIGKSDIDILSRLNDHKKGIKSNKHLQNSINKYGMSNFTFEILEQCSKEDCSNRERYWIEYYDSYNNGYNQTTGGENQSGWNLSKEARIKIGNKLRGRTFSEETRKKMSISHRNKKLTKEHKLNISKSMLGKNNHFYGKKHSKEARVKISKANSNPSEKTRELMSSSISKRNKNNVWINNGEINKFVDCSELNILLHKGWTKGRILDNKSKIGTIFINDGNINKQIRSDELDYFLSIGFSKGMIRRSKV